MFAPNGLGVRGAVENSTSQWDGDSGISVSDDMGTVAPFGQGYLLVQSRQRVTRDGGHSILAVSDPANTTRVGRGAKTEPVENTMPDVTGWGSSSSSAADWSAPEPSSSWGRQPPAASFPPALPRRALAGQTRGRGRKWPGGLHPLVAARAAGNNPATSFVPRPVSSSSGWSSTYDPAPKATHVGSGAADGWGQIADDIAREISGWGPATDNSVKATGAWGSTDDSIKVTGAWGSTDDSVKATSVWEPAADNAAWGAESAAASESVDEKSKFLPLVEYLTEMKSMGSRGVTVSSIEDRFGADIISEAVAKDYVQYVASAARPKITLAPEVELSDFASS